MSGYQLKYSQLKDFKVKGRPLKVNRDKFKRMHKKCILDENKICDNCCECFVCNLDPTKECDGCGKCLEIAEYNDIPIDEILLYGNCEEKELEVIEREYLREEEKRGEKEKK